MVLPNGDEIAYSTDPNDEDSDDEKFYFILNEEICKGSEDGKEWTIAEWMKNQGVDEYDKFGEMFKEIAFHDFFDQGRVITPQKVEMFFLACYNLDRFKDFIKDTTFLNRFEIGEEQLEKIMNDDEELLKFGFEWVKFSLFGEKTIKVKNQDNKK